MENVIELIRRYPALENCRQDIECVVNAIIKMHENGGKLLIAGNGGSAADSEHISGELLKGFKLKRPLNKDESRGIEDIADRLQRGVAAIPLSSLTALSTAFSNDVASENVFAQLVFALGKREDVFLGISTSGNSANVVNAARVASARGLFTVALTGKNGGRLAEICDVTVKVPETETYKVQELHLPVYHAVCAEVEYKLFGEKNS